jgi:hypothetical protein
MLRAFWFTSATAASGLCTQDMTTVQLHSRRSSKEHWHSTTQRKHLKVVDRASLLEGIGSEAQCPTPTAANLKDVSSPLAYAQLQETVIDSSNCGAV